MNRNLLAACLMLPTVASAQGTDLFPMTATYTCERGVEIPVAYVNAGDAAGVVVIHVEGRMISLVAGEAASGVRYAWPSDGSGYVWWTKGETAMLSWFDAEAGEEVTLYADCTRDG